MDLRVRVFFDEQGVTPEEELDELDEEATQVVAVDESGVVATCRLRRHRAGRLQARADGGRARVRGARGRGRAARRRRATRRAGREPSEMLLHAQTRAQGFYASRGYEPEGETFHGSRDRAHRDDAETLSMRERGRHSRRCAIDQLTGLRTILAPGRADRPIEFERHATDETRSTKPPTMLPVLRGDERTRPRPRSGPTGRAAATGHAGLAGARGPQPLSGAGPERARSRARAAAADRDGLTAPGRPPARLGPRRASPTSSRSRPARGCHEVVINSPQHVHLARRARRPASSRAAVAGWRERMRAHAETAAYVQLIVNEGRRRRRLARAHPRPALRARLRAGRGRPRARALRRLQRAHDGRRPARRRRLGGGAPQRAAGGDRRRRHADLPLGLALARSSCGSSRANPAPRFEDDGEVGVGDARHGAAGAAGRFGEPPELNLWVRTAPRGRRGVPLAHRHRPAARRSRRASSSRPASTSTSSRPSAPRRSCATAREALG